jgi:hypothetical protein
VPLNAVVPAAAMVICPATDVFIVGAPNVLEMVPVVTTPCGLNNVELKVNWNLYANTPLPVSVVVARMGILINELTEAEVSLNCMLIA